MAQNLFEPALCMSKQKQKWKCCFYIRRQKNNWSNKNANNSNVMTSPILMEEWTDIHDSTWAKVFLWHLQMSEDCFQWSCFSLSCIFVYYGYCIQFHLLGPTRLDKCGQYFIRLYGHPTIRQVQVRYQQMLHCWCSFGAHPKKCLHFLQLFSPGVLLYVM